MNMDSKLTEILELGWVPVTLDMTWPSEDGGSPPMEAYCAETPSLRTPIRENWDDVISDIQSNTFNHKTRNDT